MPLGSLTVVTTDGGTSAGNGAAVAGSVVASPMAPRTKSRGTMRIDINAISLRGTPLAGPQAKIRLGSEFGDEKLSLSVQTQAAV